MRVAKEVIDLVSDCCIGEAKSTLGQCRGAEKQKQSWTAAASGSDYWLALYIMHMSLGSPVSAIGPQQTHNVVEGLTAPGMYS